MRRHLPVIAFFLLSLFSLAVRTAEASSFKVNIGELVLQNLQPGQTYDLKELLNLPYRAEYDGDAEASILLSPSGYQEASDARPGYELVPDLSWLSVSSTETYVGLKGAVDAQVKISIPDDDKYLGKKYVVYLWARTQNKKNSLSVGLGAKSRFLLSISSERSSDPGLESGAGARTSLNFNVEPQETRTRKPLKVGKRYGLGRGTLGKDIVIVNKDAEARTFKLESVSGADIAMTLPEGYQWPANLGDLTFKTELLVIPPNGRAVLPAVLRIPKDPALRGKKFFYVAQIKPQTKGVSSSIVARILVETAP